MINERRNVQRISYSIIHIHLCVSIRRYRYDMCADRNKKDLLFTLWAVARQFGTVCIGIVYVATKRKLSRLVAVLVVAPVRLMNISIFNVFRKQKC